MKTIKINFCNFWDSFNPEKNLFTTILKRHFNVEISDTLDVVFCSNRGFSFDYMKYDCVRVMFAGENISPDFTVFDYFIGFDKIDFGDRYFQLPFAFYDDKAQPWEPEVLSEEKAKEILKNKEFFCNFIYRHPSSHGMRELLFDELEKYKHIVSPGSFRNNTSSSGCTWEEKNVYLSKSKFTIACDSISYPGFSTEKIVQPFQQHSIPIYYGNPTISDYFNTDAFIWCKGKDDIDRTLKEVEYLDTNDKAYIEMLTQSPFISKDFLIEKYEKLESFLLNIFAQSPTDTIRRVQFYAADTYEEQLKKLSAAALKKQKTEQYRKKIKKTIKTVFAHKKGK